MDLTEVHSNVISIDHTEFSYPQTTGSTSAIVITIGCEDFGSNDFSRGNGAGDVSPLMTAATAQTIRGIDIQLRSAPNLCQQLKLRRERPMDDGRPDVGGQEYCGLLADFLPQFFCPNAFTNCCGRKIGAKRSSHSCEL